MKYSIRVVTAVSLLSMLLFLPGGAIARSLVIASFDVVAKVGTDGTVDVTETIQPRFSGTWNGIYRTIPVEYRTSQGFNYSLFLEPVSVTDERGNELRYDVSRERHYRKFKIWVPGATDVTRTVVVHYRVENALKFFEDHDELYWNVTGDEWEVPIEAASARIILPTGATGLRALAFTGAYGSREKDATVEIQGNEVRLQMTRSLDFREGLTAVVGWDKGLVEQPGTMALIGLFLRSNWPLFIPIFVLAFMFWLWYTRGRDPRLKPVSVQYDPPEGLTPAEVGTLIDNSPDMRDITAGLVDLAVRGYIMIEEKQESQLLGLVSHKDHVFHLRKPRQEWGELQSHEQAILDGMFSGGEVQQVELSELQNKFYTSLPGIREQIFGRLMERKYFKQRPDRVVAGYLATGFVLGIMIVGGGLVFGQSTGMAPLASIVAGILTGAIIVGFGFIMPARTVAGTRAYEGILGFEEFIKRVETDRLEKLVKTPAMFEKYLPYAMALGMEKQWAGAFADIYREPPQWYRGSYTGAFYPLLLVGSLSHMSARAGTVMASAPRSVGRSGFSGGGGSSGGGFGGGGGGGF
jgi:uncharacterized membrane protein